MGNGVEDKKSCGKGVVHQAGPPRVFVQVGRRRGAQVHTHGLILAIQTYFQVIWKTPLFKSSAKAVKSEGERSRLPEGHPGHKSRTVAVWVL